MKQRTPMKRTAWPRRAREKPQKVDKSLMECAPIAIKKIVKGSGVMAQVGDFQPIDRSKENAIYSKPYRELVAKLPCIRCCIVGYSQAAHPPPTGKGRKEDDRETFPLCCQRPGIHGCHYLFDQNKLMPREAMREKAEEWAKQVRSVIVGMGAWPKNLPMWEAH